MAGNKLIQTIQSMAKPPVGETTDLLFGEVTSVSPLKIWVDNRFEVDEQFLILSALVKETIIKIPERDANSHIHIIPEHTTSQAGGGPHTHTLSEISQRTTSAAGAESHAHTIPEIPQQTTSTAGDEPHNHSVPAISQRTTGSAGEETHTHSIPAIPQQTTSPEGEWYHTHTIPEMTTYSALPDILLWRGLIVGDKVRLLRVNNGQMFYIIEREEGVV